LKSHLALEFSFLLFFSFDSNEGWVYAEMAFKWRQNGVQMGLKWR